MNLDELLKEAQNGNMVAQYNLAEYYGRRLKDTNDEDEIYRCSREAMLWLKKSARQGYGPAVDAVSELNIRADDDIPTETLLNQVPESKPEPKPEPIVQQKIIPKPAAEPVSRQETRRITPVAEPQPEPKSEPEPKPQPEPKPVPVKREQEKKKAFSSSNNAILCVLLAVSLLLNIVLLYFIVRFSKDTAPDSGNNQPPVSTAAPTAKPTAAPRATPGADPTEPPVDSPEETPASPTTQPDPETTPVPSPSAAPSGTDFWLDLSKYPELSMVPAEKDLYSDYVYYVITASDYLNMRSGAGTGYKVLASIPSMAKVGAVSEKNGWYLVYYNGHFGWVAGNYLTDDLNYGNTSASTAAPTGSSGNLRTW